MKHEHHKRTIILGIAGALVLVIIGLAGLHSTIAGVVDEMSGYIGRHPVLGAVGFAALSAISVPLAGISSILLIPVGVRHWGEIPTLALLWSGWVVGGVMTYFIGRGLGSRIALWLMSRKRVKYYQERITSSASFPLVLLFQASLPSEIPGCVLGTAKYPFGQYLIALAVVELPFAAGAVFLGDSFLKQRYWLIILVGGLGLAFMFWASHRLHHALAPAK